MLVGIGVVVYQALSSASLYFYNADEAVAQRDDLGDKRFRLQGMVRDDVDEPTGRRRHVHRHVQRRRRAGAATTATRPSCSSPGSPSCSRAAGPRPATSSTSDRILVKHSEQYEAENGDRLDDAEDAETGDPPTP